jgi:hypothetical protein
VFASSASCGTEGPLQRKVDSIFPVYLLGLLSQSSYAADLRRRKLIDRVLADFDHLLDNSTQD